MRLRRSKFAFRLRRATKNASPEVKICVSLAQGHKKCISAVVFPAQGHTKRVSGAQTLRFETLPWISAGLFSLRRATQNASPELTICLSPAQGHKKCISAVVFPAQGHTKRVSGAQTLRFETLPRISAGLFSLRRATQNASPELNICVSPAQGHKIG